MSDSDTTSLIRFIPRRQQLQIKHIGENVVVKKILKKYLITDSDI
jgi:hypothetical protein